MPSDRPNQKDHNTLASHLSFHQCAASVTLDDRSRVQGTNSPLAEFVLRSLDVVTTTKQVQHTNAALHLD